MQAKKSHLWPGEKSEGGDVITMRSVFEGPRIGKCDLWFKIPVEFADCITDSFDPFVVANVFLIMQEGVECQVHDLVSPSLLRNMAEFQAAWEAWRPGKYKQAEISADAVSDCGKVPIPEQERPAIQAFTAGIDSTFSMYRHRTAAADQPWKRNIESGLFVHGFDIPLSQDDSYARACRRMQQTLSSIGVKLITMSTNLQALNIEWDDTHIAGLASCLMLLKRRYSQGIIASGCSYHKLLFPWGSNPITDHLLSSDTFQVVHDGAGFRRIDKRAALSAWKEGYNNLRICFSAERGDENCGQCSKCLTDILHIRAHHQEIPASFPIASDEALATMTVRSMGELIGFEQLVASARARGCTDSWLEVVSLRLKELRRNMDQSKTCGSTVEKILRRFKM